MISILLNSLISDDSRLVFEVKNNDELLGSLECNISEDVLIIEKIASEIFLVDGICRTAMNYASNRGINRCEFKTQENAVWQELLRLDFVQNNNKLIDDIDNFFTSHKNCTKK